MHSGYGQAMQMLQEDEGTGCAGLGYHISVQRVV